VSGHELVVCADPAAAAATAAEVVRNALGVAIDRTGHASLAVSGGSSPGPMFSALAGAGLAWERVDLFQVDERVAADGDEARNLTGLLERLGPGVTARVGLHPVPVQLGADAAAADYAATLGSVLGPSGPIDVVHLGLGDDGHTASLVPGDAALEVTDRDVAATGEYRGHRRVTLTYAALDRAVLLVWLVTGEDKAGPLARLLARDPSIPAGRVHAARSVVVCDRAAAPTAAT
jgi:6-phosphogluconolactonase